MIPSCFTNPDSLTLNAQMPQHLITCVYKTQLSDSPTFITLTWFKTLFSHSLTIHANDSFSVTLSLLPSVFPFFRNRHGSKSISLSRHRHHYHRVKLYWDFTRAQYNRNSAEPDSGFYVAIACNAHIEFILGDLRDDALRRTGAVQMCPSAEPALLQSRREHVFGRRSFTTTAQFSGSKHEIVIECAGGVLRVKADGQIALVVKRLAWNFRGNERILVGMSEVEFYWDVFNWVTRSRRDGSGHGVFVFQVGDGGVWPEMAGPEKKLMRKSMSSSSSMLSLSPSPSCSSVLQWTEESSDGSRSSCSSSTRSSGSGGFSLLLYAWRSD
ncbi:PREDICTED: uncharacterized protein LOC104611821 [Nelumbo nucifera]|uniref:Uncharacterized protein LOC104611821 n=2 Tax=Nelumbo nucifera TaxID=4432 RepID=A0A1U8BKG5_NELNU|nr:PREDICTED: uncharacterized protein LOC104611821 [Nelumbo nucifera]DAD33671.1 TPA_asm: hypothetical protein HUJ06_012522 [Nelumbo nucifera]